MVSQSSDKHLSGPPSPTLTNPDMILPYTAEPRIPTPSPPLRPIRASSSSEEINRRLQKLEQTAGNRATVTPRNSPPLGSYGSGTMLPDIEEVETTPKVGCLTRSSSGSPRSQQLLLPKFPGMEPTTQISNDPYSKRLSHASSSGASDDFDFGNWDRFDGPTSVDGESVFGEEDDALDTAEGGYGAANPSNRNTREITIVEEDKEGALFHAALSKRAERILANAKKRLTVSLSGEPSARNYTYFLAYRAWKVISAAPAILSCPRQHRLYQQYLAKAEITLRRAIDSQLNSTDGSSHPRSIVSCIHHGQRQPVVQDIQESSVRLQSRHPYTHLHQT